MEARTSSSPQPFALRNRMPSALYNHLIAAISEFLGTVIFLYLALAGTQVAYTLYSPSGPRGSLPSAAQVLYTSIAFAFSLAVVTWIFFRVTSGLFNPAVTLGMLLIGSLGIVRAIVVAIAQFLGAMVAAALVSCMFPGPLRAQTLLGAGTSVVRGFFIEFILTAIFVFAVFMLAAEKHKGTFIAPIGIGLALLVCELAGALFTGCSLNPARSFGTAVAYPHFPGYHWIYWIAPFAGAVLAAALYKLMKLLETETTVGMEGPAAFGHSRGHSVSSTARDGITSAAPATAGHPLAPVREADVEKGYEQPRQSGVLGDQPGPRYLSGATAIGDQGASNTGTDNDRVSPMQATDATGRAY